MTINEPFIGREEEIKDLLADIFVTTPGGGHCHSLIGPNEIGKTSLVREVASRFEQMPHEHVYYLDMSMMDVLDEHSFWSFWVSVIQQLSEEIPEEKLRSAPNPDDRAIRTLLQIYEFFNDDAKLNMMGGFAFHSKATLYLNKIFAEYTNLGIHIIMTIDEFDVARTKFPVEDGDGSFFQRLFSLTEKGTARLNLTILLISRRRIGTVAHHMAEGSDIESAFPPITLRGFTDKDLDTYFESYAQLPCGLLDQETKEDVLYFCGRHPGLLTKMRREIAKYDGEGMPNITEIYAENGTALTNIYNRMSTLLKTEYVNRTDKINCVDTFVQVFVGPAYEPQLPGRLEQLYSYGFITRVYKGAKNIFELCGEPEKMSKEFLYEPLAPYFVEYVKERVLPEDLLGLGRFLSETEINVRKMILHVMQKNHPDNWVDILGSYMGNASNVKHVSRRNLNQLAVENDAFSKNIVLTDLNVMAFPDYAKIICDYWEDMKLFVQSYTAEELKEQFEELREARNSYAHNNSQVLNERTCARIREICTRITQDMDDGYEGKVRINAVSMSVAPVERPTATQAVASPDGLTVEKISAMSSEQKMLLEKSMLAKVNVNDEIMTKLERKANGGVRGVLKGSGARATISKKQAVVLPDMLPMELPVRITDWDGNPNTYDPSTGQIGIYVAVPK